MATIRVFPLIFPRKPAILSLSLSLSGDYKSISYKAPISKAFPFDFSAKFEAATARCRTEGVHFLGEPAGSSAAADQPIGRPGLFSEKSLGTWEHGNMGTFFSADF